MKMQTIELAMIMEAVDRAAFALTRPERWGTATIYSASKAALPAIANPGRRSGQRLVKRVHQVIRESRL